MTTSPDLRARWEPWRMPWSICRCKLAMGYHFTWYKNRKPLGTRIIEHRGERSQFHNVFGHLGADAYRIRCPLCESSVTVPIPAGLIRDVS